MQAGIDVEFKYITGVMMKVQERQKVYLGLLEKYFSGLSLKAQSSVRVLNVLLGILRTSFFQNV